MDHHDLLGRREHGLQMMSRVRALPKDIALLPLVNGLLGDPKTLGQGTGIVVTGRDLSAHGRRGAGVLVQGNQNGFTTWVVARTLSTFAGRLWP